MQNVNALNILYNCLISYLKFASTLGSWLLLKTLLSYTETYCTSVLLFQAVSTETEVRGVRISRLSNVTTPPSRRIAVKRVIIMIRVTHLVTVWALNILKVELSAKMTKSMPVYSQGLITPQSGHQAEKECYGHVHCTFLIDLANLFHCSPSIQCLSRSINFHIDWNLSLPLLYITQLLCNKPCLSLFLLCIVTAWFSNLKFIFIGSVLFFYI